MKAAQPRGGIQAGSPGIKLFPRGIFHAFQNHLHGHGYQEMIPSWELFRKVFLLRNKKHRELVGVKSPLKRNLRNFGFSSVL